MQNSSTIIPNAMLRSVALALTALIAQPHLRAATTADYVQDSLVACWDGVENAGAGQHNATPSKWIDIVGGRAFTLNNISVGVDRMTFSGATTSYALLSKADTTDTFSAARSGTLEVVYALSSTSVPQFLLQSSTGSSSDKSLAFALWQTDNIIVASGTSSKRSPYFAFTSGTATNFVAVRYSAGGSVSAVGNGGTLTSPGTQYYGTDATGTTVLGKRLSNAYPFSGSIYCIRLYSRQLTDDEIAANQNVDAVRFLEGRTGVVIGAATATTDRREASFTANLATLNGNATATVSLWIGTASAPSTFSPVGEAKTVTDTSAFSWDWTLPSYVTPYYWQVRAVGEDGIVAASAVASLSAPDDTFYTWSGGASGNWSDPSNWTHDDVDCIGYPASSAATAYFEADTTAAINFDASVSFGTLVATNRNIDIAFTAAPGVAVTNTLFDMGDYTVVNPGLGRVRLNGVNWYSTTSTTMSLQTGRSLVLDGGANLSVQAFYPGLSKVHYYWPETTVSVLNGSTLATRGNFYFSGHTTLLISNATVRCGGVLYGEYVTSTYKAKGGRIVFAGKHPLLAVSGSACTSYGYTTYGVSGVDYDFLIPEGGYDEPPFQYSGSGVFMKAPSGSVYKNQRFNVLSESPAVLTGEALDETLVSVTTAMTSALLIDLCPCEGVTRTMEKSADNKSIVFRQTPSSRLLTVTASPTSLAGPDYSSYTNLVAGDELTLTCPAAPTDYGYISCGGYRLYDVAGDGTRTEVAGSPFPGTVCNYVHAGGRRELEWIWETPILHVSTTGDDANTGADWDHALASPQAALDRYAYATVLLAPDTYSSTATLVVTNAVTLAGCGTAPADTKLSKTVNETRVLIINNPLAVVSNLLVTNGKNTLQGGVTLSFGLLTDCVVTNCDTKNNTYHGGGVWMSGGTVRRCSIVGNVARSSGGSGYKGGGIYMTGGLVENCRILDNTHSSAEGGSSANGGGGGVYMSNGTLRNCLVARNWARVNGFGVWAEGGRIENCTIADNVYSKVNSSGAGLTLSGSASAMNCIVVGNANLNGEANVSCATGARFQNGCSAPAIAKFPDNVDADPRFTDPSAGDYTLGGFSQCVNSGLALDWHADAVDLAGNPRVLGPAVDMGCYERPVSTTLDCSFTLSSDDGVDRASISLNASVDGDTTGIAYYWTVSDQDGNAVTNFVAASPQTEVTLAPNNYTVSLAVTNGVGSAASFTIESAVRVLASLAYLNVAGSDIRPYATLETGAHDLEEAFEMLADGGTLLVADGTYLISNRVNMVSGRGIAIRSINGPEGAVVRAVSSSYFSGSKLPFFRLASSNARLEGLTIVGGYPGPYNSTSFRTYNAVVVAADGAVVSNCVVRDVYGVNNGPDGTGVSMSYGTLVDTHILNCCVSMSGGTSKSGAGLYMTGGTAERIVVSNCYTTGTSTSFSAKGGAVYTESGTVRNSLVTACTGSWAPVVYATGSAKIDNCTIAGNRSTVSQSKTGSSLYHVAGLLVDTNSTATVRNCIVAENSNDDLGETNLWWKATGNATVRHTLVTGADAIEGVGNVAAPSAVFANSANGNYSLRFGSPARNAGEWLDDWMDAESIDLSRQPRLIGPTVDMGCFECQKPEPTRLLLL